MNLALKKTFENIKRIFEMRKLIFFCLFCLVYSGTEAQNSSLNTLGVVKGQVVDKNDGSTLIGCTVQVKGKKATAITNSDGFYEIQAEPGDILIFSYIGYENIEVKAGSKDAKQIRMIDNAYLLDNVVVTGYQKLKKFNVTGSVNTINKDKISIRSSVGLEGILEGAVPGLTVYKNDFKIRGGASLNAGNKPLFIVDDFEVQTLPENMDNVANITVLKDAAPTAIWGSRASNGVIVITTKEGSSNDFKISYSNNFRISAKPDYDDLNRANSIEMIDFFKDSFKGGYSSMQGGYGNQGQGYSLAQEIINDYVNDYNWETGAVTTPERMAEMEARLDKLALNSNRKQIEDMLLRNSFRQQHNLSISGGSSKVNYYLSGSFSGGHSEYIGDKYLSVNINSRTTYKILPCLKLKADLAATVDKNDNGYSDIQSDIYNLFPYQMLVDANGNRIQDYSQFSKMDADMWEPQGLMSFGKNILDEVDMANNISRNLDVKGKFGLDLRIIDGLNVTADYQLEKFKTTHKNIKSINSYDVRYLINKHTDIDGGELTYHLPKGDVLDHSQTDIDAWTFKVGATLNKNFGARKEHYVNAVAGFEMRDRHRTSQSYRKLGYNDQVQSWGTFDQQKMASEGTTPVWLPYKMTYDATDYDRFSDALNREVSYYLSGVYTYDDRYTVSASMRIDKSNLFGVSDKYKKNPIWAFGANWNIKNEKFFKCNAITALMLRTSLGLTGNFDRSGSTSPVMVGRFIPNSVVGGYMRITTPPNPLLRWERTKSFNVSVDLGLFDRINATFVYYNNHNYDLLGEKQLDPTVGYESQRINAADMENNGFEMELNADVIRTRDFTWNINLVYAYNKNKITKNDLVDSDPVINRTIGISRFVEGYAREGLWSYRWAGLNEKGMPQVYKADGTTTTDPNQITVEDIEFSGTYQPKHSGSFSTGLRYKGLQANFLFTYNFGHVFRVEYPDMNPFEISPVLNKMIGKRWRKPGDEKFTDIPAIMDDVNNFWDYYDGLSRFGKYSSNSIRNGNMIRLREILVNYELPGKWLSHTPLKILSLTAQLNNIWLWTANREGYDPEAVSPVSGSFSLAEPVSFTLGLKADF